MAQCSDADTPMVLFLNSLMHSLIHHCSFINQKSRVRPCPPIFSPFCIMGIAENIHARFCSFKIITWNNVDVKMHVFFQSTALSWPFDFCISKSWSHFCLYFVL
ncbi:hypothetical protein AGOR_G00239890 [Albula goreensis]|uniref:Uncharacterized protein n=1 Tax=Albula goreensis TaxID=1534307 RepID=A0A8T3CDB9_9TELE|nr:hypothetical protein AGOR_G00239890 [Albula goreensis]